jgi:hypothetical protein
MSESLGLPTVTRAIDYTDLFSAYDSIENTRRLKTAAQSVTRNALQKFIFQSHEVRSGNGFTRIQRCRDALDSIDRQGYTRSFHQRLFHDNFIRACARIFWKTEPPGTFARHHQKILESNGWDHLSQEILVSTPRRFGKTFAVSMFAAAMLYSTPSLELSIYSTCKRISQKLMRNVTKFLAVIYKDTKCQEMPVIRSNMEEVVLQGPDGLHDVRTVNSYPSKVTQRGGAYTHTENTFIMTQRSGPSLKSVTRTSPSYCWLRRTARLDTPQHPPAEPLEPLPPSAGHS